MPELSWTRGFCNNPKCGRYIRHFGNDVACPQCGKLAPNQVTHGLSTFGIEYIVGLVLGILTCSRWAPSRIAERIIWHVARKPPRMAEEVTVIFYTCIAILFSLWTCARTIQPLSAWAVLISVLFVWRVLEIVAIRIRIILYDRRQLEWRYASYARSIILLLINVVEIVAIYAFFYSAIYAQYGHGFPGLLDPFAYSLAAFFSMNLAYLDCMPDVRLVDLARLAELLTAFFLLAIGFAALVNMMGSGKEVHTRQNE